MITRSVMIRAGKGYIKVLRLHANTNGIWPFGYVVSPGLPFCRFCGCTDLFGCTPPCSWANAEKTICSRCLGRRLLP